MHNELVDVMEHDVVWFEVLSSNLQTTKEYLKNSIRISLLQAEIGVRPSKHKNECYTLDCGIQSHMFFATALDIDWHVYIPPTLPTMIERFLFFHTGQLVTG